MNLKTELIIRIILVVAIIDSLMFYFIHRTQGTLTYLQAVEFIILTIIVLIINVLYCLYRNGIK